MPDAAAIGFSRCPIECCTAVQLSVLGKFAEHDEFIATGQALPLPVCSRRASATRMVSPATWP